MHTLKYHFIFVCLFYLANILLPSIMITSKKIPLGASFTVKKYYFHSLRKICKLHRPPPLLQGKKLLSSYVEMPK
jgi:hypothetical protein